MKNVVMSALLALAALPAAAQHTVTPPSAPRLPMATVFKGEAKFRAIVQQAEKENWRQLPIGARTIRAARAMVGTPFEARVSKLPVYHIPRNKVQGIEGYLQDGDVCAITTNWKDGYTSHVGLIVKLKGRAYFTHATSDRDKGRMTIIDRPITDYLNGSSKHAGIVVVRPNDLPPSRFWARPVAGR
jgi:hypothetical protein